MSKAKQLLETLSIQEKSTEENAALIVDNILKAQDRKVSDEEREKMIKSFLPLAKKFKSYF